MLLAVLGFAVATALATAPPVALVPTVVEPRSLPPHPRLVLNARELASLKQRLERSPWARRRYDGLKASADAWLTRTVELPDRGSQWWHYYACKVHGARLRTESPTRHVCPIGGEVYSGYPYDDVVLAAQHSELAQAAWRCGLVYAVEGDARYAARAREILLAYADRYAGYPLHDIRGEAKVGGGKVGPQTLDEAVWLLPMAEAADLVWNTLSAADRQRLEQGLFRPAVKVIEDHKMGIHNIQCWKNSAVGVVGLLLGDAGMIDRALNAPSGFHNQVAKGITDDGPWFEGAWGYHFYTVSALVHLTEAAWHSGINLYGPRLKKVFDAPLEMAMPDLTLPAFHDSGAVNLLGSASVFEIAYARYADPRYRVLLSQTDRQSDYALLYGAEDLGRAGEGTFPSRDFPAAGFAILRAGKGKPATYLALDYGPHGGGHGHPDKLSFVLYSRGQVVAPDPGTAAYGVPIQAEWYRTSLAHNTFTIDERSQQAAEGKLEAFTALPGLSLVSAWAGPIHEGVDFRRTAALLEDDLLLFIDRIRSSDTHTYDLAYHNLGAFAAGRGAGTPWQPPKQPGYLHLRDASILSAEEARRPVSIQMPGGTTAQVCFAEGPPTELIRGTGVGANTEDRVPLLIARRQARGTDYLWGVALGKGRSGFRVEAVPVRGEAVADAAALRCLGGREEVVLLASPGGVAVEAGGLKTDARVACARSSGRAARLYLVEGKELAWGKLAVRAESPTTLSVEVANGRPVSITAGDRPVEVTLTRDGAQPQRVQAAPGQTRPVGEARG